MSQSQGVFYLRSFEGTILLMSSTSLYRLHTFEGTLVPWYLGTLVHTYTHYTMYPNLPNVSMKVYIIYIYLYVIFFCLCFYFPLPL